MDGLQLRQIAELQRRLLPQRIVQPKGWHIAAYNSIATRPGGDYYDVLPLPDGRLFLIVADASGHGGPSAVLVALTRMIIHSCPLSSGIKRAPFCPLYHPIVQPPHVLLGHLNNVLCENCLDDQFMTAFCATLDPATGTLVYANAGHPPPYLRHEAQANTATLQAVSGYPLCVVPNHEYPCAQATMDPGDLLVAYTDGFLEAMKADGEPFGSSRLAAAIAVAAAQGAHTLKEKLLERLGEFLAGRAPDDDVTLLILERCPR